MNTTPPLMVVSSGLSSISLVTISPSLMGLTTTSGQCEVVLPPPLMLRCPEGVIGLASMPQQQPPSLMPLLAYANYANGFSIGRFLFQNSASHQFVYYMFGIHSGVCFLLSGAMLDAVFPYGGSTISICTIATLWSLPMAGICATWWWSSVHAWYAQSGCFLHYLE